MTKEKWFLTSRSVLGAVLPAVVAVVALFGVDTTDLHADLDRLGLAIINLVGSALVLRSRFAPDGAALRALPTGTAPPPPAHAVVVWIALTGIFLGGCHTPATTYWHTRGMVIQAQEAYNHVLERDNEQIRRCYAAHPDLQGADARAACPAWVPESERGHGLQITTRIEAEFDAIEPLLDDPDATTAQQIDAALGRLEGLALELLAIYGGRR